MTKTRIARRPHSPIARAVPAKNMMVGSENDHRGPDVVEQMKRAANVLGGGTGPEVEEEDHGRQGEWPARARLQAEHGRELAPDIFTPASRGWNAAGLPVAIPRSWMMDIPAMIARKTGVKQQVSGVRAAWPPRTPR